MIIHIPVISEIVIRTHTALSVAYEREHNVIYLLDVIRTHTALSVAYEREHNVIDLLDVIRTHTQPYR